LKRHELEEDKKDIVASKRIPTKKSVTLCFQRKNGDKGNWLGLEETPYKKKGIGRKKSTRSENKKHRPTSDAGRENPRKLKKKN